MKIHVAEKNDTPLSHMFTEKNSICVHQNITGFFVIKKNCYSLQES